MKSLISTFVIFIGSVIMCYSQEPETVYIELPGRYSIGITAADGFKIPESRIVGSPYLLDNYQKGKLYLEKNKVVKDFVFNYNVCLNRIEFKENGETMIITKPEKIIKVLYNNNQIFEYVTYEEKKFLAKNVVKRGFMQLLSDGPVKLYKAFHCSLSNPNYNVSMMAGNRDYEFHHSHSYYIQKNTTATEIKPRKNKVLKALSQDRSKVKEYIEMQNLNLRDENDLIRLFDYYNNHFD